MRLFLMTGIIAALCACGVKPGGVSSPSGADPDPFPHTYPAPEARP